MAGNNERYQIIRTPGTLVDLERAVGQKFADGWDPLGAPFRCAETLEWCQAMTKREPKTEPGEVRLREPRAEVKKGRQ